MRVVLRTIALLLIVAGIGLTPAAAQPAQSGNQGFSVDELVGAGHKFFGTESVK